MAKAPIQVVWFKRDMRMNHDLSLSVSFILFNHAITGTRCTG
ncbi:hypothetical protein [Vreelandella venusta]|nr:hypothetical protein [Halomonas venusta]